MSDCFINSNVVYLSDDPTDFIYLSAGLYSPFRSPLKSKLTFSRNPVRSEPWYYEWRSELDRQDYQLYRRLAQLTKMQEEQEVPESEPETEDFEPDLDD